MYDGLENSTTALMAEALELAGAADGTVSVEVLNELLERRTKAGPLTVTEVGEGFGLSPHTIRYYERVGLLEVPRDHAGHRVYRSETIRRLAFLIRMRISGMSVGDLQHYLDLVKLGDASTAERLDLMLEHRDTIRLKIRELQLSLAVTEYKIARYAQIKDRP